MRKLLVVLVLALCAGGASAQGTADTVELTPVVGYWFGDTLAQGTTGTFDFDVTIDDDVAAGLRLAYKFTENWALDGVLVRESADLVTGHDELFGGESKIGGIDLTTAEIGFEGSFGHSRLVPFIGGGIGAMHLDPDLAGMSSDTRFVANFGAGFKLFFTPRLAFRFDWRGHSVNVGDREDECDWWEDCAHNDEWLTFREVSIGLTFVL
jgi:hypothetical protein